MLQTAAIGYFYECHNMQSVLFYIPTNYIICCLFHLHAVHEALSLQLKLCSQREWTVPISSFYIQPPALPPKGTRKSWHAVENQASQYDAMTDGTPQDAANKRRAFRTPRRSASQSYESLHFDLDDGNLRGYEVGQVHVE